MITSMETAVGHESVAAPSSSTTARAPRSWTAFAAALVAALVVALLSISSVLSAQFGPVDDHEPLSWLGSDGRLDAREFWTTLAGTEVSQWGGFLRFRPAYYSLRIGQAILFGDNPTAWYWSILITYALTCAIAGYAVALWVSCAVQSRSTGLEWLLLIVGSVLATWLFAGMNTWSGIATRLGASELPGLFSSALVLLALTKVSLGHRRLWWVLALAGCFIAVFSKEPFVSLVLVFPIVGLFSYLTYGRRKLDLIAGFSGLVPGMLLVGILAPSLSQSSTDIYGKAVGGSRLRDAVWALLNTSLRSWVFVAFALFIAWGVWASTLTRRERGLRIFILALSIWLVGILLLDAWFYGGQYGSTRYRAVMDLSLTLQTLAAVCLSIAAIRGSNTKVRAAVTAVSLVISCGALAQAVSATLRGYASIGIAVAANLQATDQYQRGLSDALQALALEPEAQLVVVATNGGQYEPAYAVLNEVARRTNDSIRQFMIVPPLEDKPTDPLLEGLAALGIQGSTAWHLLPRAGLSPDSFRVCIFLYQAPFPLPECEPGVSTEISTVGIY